MYAARWPAVLLSWAVVTTELPAQGIYCTSSIGLGKVTISFGSPRAYVPPYIAGYVGVVPAIGYLPATQPTYLQFYTPPAPLIVGPPRRQLSPDEDLGLSETLPGVPASVFRPVGRANRAQAQRKAPADKEKAKEKPDGAKKPQRVPQLPRPAGPEEDPQAECARQIRLGADALKRQEYGRATQRFQLAGECAAKDALARFLLGQSHLALGKYREAVEAIEVGLSLKPDWPTADFKPRELYGPNAADFAVHLHRLKAALDRHPEDPILLFLFAYELWFDGRKDEAWPLFQKAASLAPDKRPAELFLKHRPGLPVVVR